MGHDVDHPGLLKRREADRGPGVIGEDQEGAAIGDHAAVQRHAVHRRGHPELANPVIEIAAGIILFRQRLLILCFGIVRTREVGRAADRLGQERVDRPKRHLRSLARGDLLRVGDQALDVIVERKILRQVARHAP